MLTLTLNFYIMASLKFILKTQQEDKTGKCPLYIRLIKDRKAKFISTGIKLEKNQWDEAKQKVRKNFPNSTRLNAVLAAKIADASVEIMDQERKIKSVNAEQLKKALLGADSVNFFQYAYKTINTMRGNISENTYFNYIYYVDCLKEFAGTDELTFEDITLSLIKEYVSYSITVKGLKTSSVKSSLIPLSAIYNTAIDEQIIDKSKFPFDKIKLKSQPAKRNFLTLDQIEALKNYKPKEKSKRDICRDMFLFAVSSAGLRFSDVVTLTWENIDLKTGIIERRIGKTGRRHRLKMGATAQEIIQKYKPKTEDKKKLVFPAISQNIFDSQDQVALRTLITNSNAIFNYYLKCIGTELEFPFPVHFHMSRHTFATQALSKGMRIEFVSKLMDHSNIKTTQIYAKIINEDLDKAVDTFVI